VAAVPAEIQGPSDAELIDAVRGGQVDAFGSLYERHVSAAYNLARQLARSRAESDDLVSEAFARVLDTLRAGRGPDSAFRAYLLTALRHVAYDKTRRDRKVELTDDVTAVSGVATEKISEPFRDTAVAGLERSLAAKAYARLPERWQAVLWHTEIEGQSPAEVAPLLGLTANGVSALAYRAREGLREAYLQVHLAETATGTTAERCRATTEKLGAWTRGGLSKRETAQVEAHLDECERCRALAAELADENSGLRVIATLVLGIGAAGYLATTAKASAGVALATSGAAAASGGAGAAAGAASSLPRQFVGVGASVAALAVALILALTGGTAQHIPAAAAPPPTVAPAPPPKPPAPQPPPPVVPPPPVQPTPAPPNPTPAPTTPAPSPTPAPPPPPGHPTLTASGPAITLVPGQGSVALPITVVNTGNAPSQPVTATLNLPPGVSVTGPVTAAGTRSLHEQQIGSPRTTPPPAAPVAPVAAGSVTCPPGTGTVSCTSPSGLQPGQSVVLVFQLVAAPGTMNGQITGTVSAGMDVSVMITVQVRVPALVDELALTAQLDKFDSWWNWLWDGSPIIDVTATNTGTSTKPVTIVADRSSSLWQGGPDFTCVGGGQQVTCTTDEALAPKQSAHLRLRLYHLRSESDMVTVVGTLGSATRTAQVAVEPPKCLWFWCFPVAGPDGAVTTTPPATTTPPTTDPTKTGPPSTTHTPRPGPDPTGAPVPGAPPTTTTTPPPPVQLPTTVPPPTQPGCATDPGPGKYHPGDLCNLVPAVLSLLGPL
jgi:RNA polymerase sigma factor (sigma-70 family)